MKSKKDIVAIKTSKDNVLSKEQKRFNNYINKIKKLRQQIEEFEAFHRDIPARLQKELGPLEEKEGALRKELVLLLDTHPLKGKLTKRQQEKLSLIIQDECLALINEYGHEDMKELYDRYSDMSYEEEQKMQEEAVKEMAGSFFKNVFGINLDKEALDDPEKMIENITQQMEEQQQAQANRPQRKKTKAQIAKEARQAEEEKRISQTSKSIYLELVKKFHPDKEQDPEKKAWMTDVMQQVTSAYQEDNFLRLLELQISLLEGKDKSLESIPDDHLKYYNKLLKNQVDELEETYRQHHPFFGGSPYGQYFGPPHLVEMKIKAEIEEVQTTIRQLQHSLSGLDSLPELKEFVKNFQVNDDDNFMPSFFF